MIRANHVTLLRMILLPIPCYLMFGGFAERVAALIIFTMLGLTDYFDGYLARKHGVTTLGALLDPIADKIFITAVYIPFARMEIVPLWMVVLLLIREYMVVELRSISASSGIMLKTATLAKYKTSIQMLGAGFIFLIDTLGQSPYVFIPLGGCLLLPALPGFLSWNRVRRIGPRTMTSVVLVGTVFCARLFLPPQKAIWIIMAIILAITLASGIHYFTTGTAHLRAHLLQKFKAREWTAFLGATVVFPILYVSLAQSKSLAAWVVIAILSLEFAIGGLDNLLLALGVQKDYNLSPKLTFFQNAMGTLVIVILIIAPPGYHAWAQVIVWAVLAVTFLHSFRQFYVHRVHFLSA